MIEARMLELNAEYVLLGVYPPVTVQGGDYTYTGWLVAVFRKKRNPAGTFTAQRRKGARGAVRCVVEDANGRLFIHNAEQITERT